MKMKTTISILLTSSALIALATASGSAATIAQSPPDARGNVFIDIKGDISYGDDKTFDDLLIKIKNTKKVIVRLSSNGGSFLASMG